MGNLLGAPVTEKETISGLTADGTMEYSVSSMQGWRVHMEDAHIMEGTLYAEEAMVHPGSSSTSNNNHNNSNNTSVVYHKVDLPGHVLFAVFDGHGGTFAAAYAGRNFCRVLSRQLKFVQYAKLEHDRPNREKNLTTSQERSILIQASLNLLRDALCDTFIDLDREIALALRGIKLPEADQPYHLDKVDHHNADSNHSSHNNTNDTMDGSNDIHTDNSSWSSSSSSPAMQPQPPPTTSPSDAALKLLEGEGDSGTTACVVVVTPEWIVCANAGDSRAVMSKLGHKAVALSYDHKPDDEMEERRIRAAGGYVAAGRVEGDLAVSRGLGDFRFKQMNIVMAGSAGANETSGQDGSSASSSAHSSQFQGRPGDQKVSPVPDIIVQNRNPSQDEFIIIACDGIWDVLTNYEAVRSVADLFQEGESNIGLVCEEMCDLCLSMGSKDNMTVMIIKFASQKVGEGGGVGARRQQRNADSDTRAGKAMTGS